MEKPIYQGQALSMLLRLSKAVASENRPELWMWGPVWRWITPNSNIPHSLDAISNLVGQGWTHWDHSNAELESQLGNIIRLTREQEKGNTWIDTWYQLAEDEPEPAPVILSFSLGGVKPSEDNIPMLNPVPPPQLGEYALIEDSNGGLLIYGILALPLEARQRWLQMGEALRALSSPLQWPGFTLQHQTASNQLLYNRELAALQTKRRLSLPIKTKLAYMAEEVQLGAARLHIEELYKQLEKETWLEEWEQARRLAHDLARDYYIHHLKQQIQAIKDDVETLITSETLEPTLEEPASEEAPLQILDTPMPIEQNKKRGRRPHAPATGIIAKGKDTVTIGSDTLNREIINALRDGNTYDMHKDELIAEHKHMFSVQKERGQIIITLRGLAGEGFETILSAINTLGDGCIDTFIAVQAIAIDKNGTEHIRTPIEMSPDDILEVCGKKKSHGSYTAYQRAEVIAHLKTLSQAHVIATLPGRPGRGKRDKGTFIKVEGALIDLLSWKIGEYKTITGEEIWERRSISVGQWVTMVPEMSDRTAIMLRKILAYSAKNQRYHKRLGIYLTLLFRINAHKGSSFDVSMEKLLEGAGIVPDRHRPGQFKDAIEHALQTLQADNVIGIYAKLFESNDTKSLEQREALIQQMGKGWFDLYSKQIWRFHAPDRSKEQYKQLKRVEPES